MNKADIVRKANVAAIYVRLSDEDKDKRNVADESESIQNQKSMLLQYCLEKGWDVYDIYCDEDYSGVDRNRPEFNRLLKDCEDGRVGIVVCKTQSRFSRDMEQIEKYLHDKFLEWSIRFVSIVDNADTDIKGNKKSRQINGLVNEWFLEDLSDNIRRTLNHKKLQGEFCSGFTPYGYAKDSDNKNKLIIDETAAEIVRRIFAEYLSGVGVAEITRQLNNRGVPNPTKYKQDSGLNYKCRAKNANKYMWSKSTVRGILKREAYIGSVVQGKSSNVSYKNKKRVQHDKDDWIIIPDMHEAIIEKDVWLRVQSSFETRTRQSKSTGKKHKFSGRVICEDCRNPMTIAQKKKDGYGLDYLRCNIKWSAPSACDNSRALRIDKLESEILSDINALLDNHYNAELIKFDLPADSGESKRSRLESVCRNLEVELSQKEKIVKELYADKVEGVISTEQFIEFNRDYTNEISPLRAEIARIQKEVSALEDACTELEMRDNILKKYRQIDELTWTVMDEFIEKIIVGTYDKEHKTRTIDIIWKI